MRQALKWAGNCAAAGLLCWICLAGCDGGGPPAAGDASAPEPAYAAAKGTAPAAQPDDFADVSAALAALRNSAAPEGSDDDARRRAEEWLVWKGEAAVEPAAAMAADETTPLAARIHLCRILGRLGPLSKPHLFALIDNPAQLVRVNAAKNLALIKPADDEIIARLIELIDDDDRVMRQAAMRALAHLGPRAKAAAPRLQEILNSREEETIRSAAKDALTKVNPRRTLVN